jgi:hypothetical protein
MARQLKAVQASRHPSIPALTALSSAMTKSIFSVFRLVLMLLEAVFDQQVRQEQSGFRESSTIRIFLIAIILVCVRRQRPETVCSSWIFGKRFLLL